MSMASQNTTVLQHNGLSHYFICGDSASVPQLSDSSVHLAVTSPPYFNVKTYSDGLDGDLGNIDDLDEWLDRIGETWKETLRVLADGRKFFLNIMNLPVKDGGTFRTLNLVGKTIDLCEKVGFIFKREIIWSKTHGAKAHFGSYPYPGGILINNMHESILEFQKPDQAGVSKYAHVTAEQKEESKLDREFWLSIKNSDVWTMNPEKSGKNRDHIAPFPEEIPRRLIKAFSYKGETVYDPFGGSGTTSAAALKLGRCSVSAELNPEFIKMSIARLQKICGCSPLL